MRVLIIGAAGLALASFLPAQQTKVIPAAAASSDGSTLSVYPTGYGGGRVQQIILNTAVGRSVAMLRELRWRIDARNAIVAAKRFPNMSLWISETSVSPSKMSSSFASNRSGQPTLAFKGTLNAPAQTGVPSFNIVWKLSRPFFYKVAKGHLLLEWELPQKAYKPNYFIDAHKSNSSPGSFVSFGKSGKFSANESYIVKSDLSKMLPGGTMEFQASGLSKQYPGLVCYGFSRTKHGPLNLPFDMTPLGAPGNWLYVSMDLFLPFTWSSGAGGMVASAGLWIPKVTGLDGLTVYAQGLFLDAKANAFGMVTSPGVAMRMPISGMVTSMLGSYDYQAARGSLSLGKGIVTQLVGVLP
ncbi:MAG: hypothetical protein CSA62_07530 [Planctomycetota bacterium]|nr:MAG: hypothetical protein CSA62_07530 [Planctomycetota bacterium]